MNRISIFSIVLANCLLSSLCLSQKREAVGNDSVANESNLILTPLLQSAALNNGLGTIPFSARNDCAKAVSIVSFVELMTTTDSGSKISIEHFRSGNPMGGGIEHRPVILQPGETGTFDGISAMETFAFVRDGNKTILGELSARVVGTKQGVGPCFSEPFSVPNNLVNPPWTDLGVQNYLTVTTDTNNIGINPHKLDRGIWLRGSLMVPISIKNISGQPSVAASDSISFYIARDDGKRTQPSPWDTIGTSASILKPGESVLRECDIDLDWLESEHYKPGEKLVVAVGGRIPNSNQIFECYSAPFGLPPLPDDKPPKGTVQIPGL
jgi:hypothetical protein